MTIKLLCYLWRERSPAIPKIIFTSRYLRDVPSTQLNNYVRYIGTREGVEKTDDSNLLLPATINQQKLIRQLVRDIPASREMLEYADILLHPTIGNASEFISCALEQNLDLITKRENYVDYIANRPRVERVGEHGLFTDAGKPVVLSKVQEEVTHHKGPVWTHVVSLRREDAARLGYDSAKQWMALLRSKRAMLCKHMKIDSADLRWYAAFHNEGHHPHVHLMVYSAKDNGGFLTRKSIEAMRSELAHDIFRQDFAHIYEEQNQAREELKSGTADVLREMMDALSSGTLVSPEIAEMMELLAARLQNTGGKKVYGYLKRDVKNLIDKIVDELAKDSRMAALYQAWGKWNDEILLTYRSTAPPLTPLSQQPQFKSIKNMVIAEAMTLGGHHFTFEDEQVPEPELTEEFPEPVTVCKDGIGTEKDMDTAGVHFEDAFTGFFQLEQENHDDKLQYRLGQMLHCGTGTEKDDVAAADYWERSAKLGNVNAQYALGKLWLESSTGEPEPAVAWISKAADAGNAAAQYSLGKIYKDGEYAGRDMRKAVELFTLSAEQDNEYSAYQLGRLYLSGEDVPRDVKAAVKWLTLSARLGNQFAQYTLANLYLSGEDVSRNVPEALKLLQLSAEQKNQFAEYQLGKLYLSGEAVPKDVEAAIMWLSHSADQGNRFAQYALGKLYLCGHEVPRDKEKAVPFLQSSAVQGNIYAQFLLEHLDSFRDPSPFLAATRLLHRLENLFRENTRRAAGDAAYHIDRKRRRRLAEKKQAQGHKRDDQEPLRQQTY